MVWNRVLVVIAIAVFIQESLVIDVRFETVTLTVFDTRRDQRIVLIGISQGLKPITGSLFS